MVLLNDDFCIRQIDLPCSVKALVALDENGFHNIFVNSRLSRETQCEAVKHELRHIYRNDFYNNIDIRDVEDRRGA